MAEGEGKTTAQAIAMARLEAATLKAALAQQQLDAAAAKSAASMAASLANVANMQAAAAARAASEAEKSAQAQANAAQKAAQAQARANAAGMAAMSAMMNAKHKADADVALSAAKAEAIQSKAVAAQMAAQAKLDAAHAKSAAAMQTSASAARDNASAMDVSSLSISGAFDALKAAGPEGYALAMALTVITAGVVALSAALIGCAAAAIKVAEAKEEMLAMFGALAGGEAAGAGTVAMIQKLSVSLPFATQQIATWAKGLLSAGVSAKNLEASIIAIASAQALMGESGGAAAESMIKQLAEGGKAATDAIKGIQEGSRKSATKLAEMGLQAKDLADAMGMTEAQFKKASISADKMGEAINKALTKKGAGALENMVGDLATIVMKAKEGFMSLFRDLSPAVKPFMASLAKLLGLFGKTGAVTNALRPIVTAVFSTLFAWGTKAIDVIRGMGPTIKAIGKFFEPVIATFKSGGGALGRVFTQLKTALAPTIAMLKALFSNAQTLKGIQIIFRVIATVIVAVVVVLAVIIAKVIQFVAVFAAAVAMVVGFAANIVGSVVDSLSGITDALGNMVSGAGEAAANFVSGLADGIAAGAGAILAAVTGLASGAVGAFKSAMGIASPSKVMMQMGGHMASGVAEGVDDGAPKAQAATAALVDPKALKVGKANGAGAGKSVTFSDCTFGDVSETTIRGWVLKALDEDGFAGPVVPA